MHDDIHIENSTGSARNGSPLRIVETSTVMGSITILLNVATVSHCSFSSGRLFVPSSSAHGAHGAHGVVHIHSAKTLNWLGVQVPNN